MNPSRIRWAVILLGTLVAPSFAHAQGMPSEGSSVPSPAADDKPARELRDGLPPPASDKPTGERPPGPADPRVEELNQKVRMLEQRWEVEQEALAARKEEERKNVPSVAFAYGKDGAGIKSADGKFQFRLRPLLQADGRFYISEGTNTFLLRRVRPVIEGTVFEFFDWRILPELAGTPNVQEAYGNVRFLKEMQFRIGKFKSPVGLERLAADSDLRFVERGLPTQFAPDRDVGVQVHGELFDGTLSYAIGYLNGVGDAVNGDVDNNDKKDWVGRIVVKPFQPTSIGPLRGLGLGMAATRGTHIGALPAYRTAGQATFFQYSDGVAAAGTQRRLAPQAFYYFGPVGAFGEYTVSSQVVAGPAVSELVAHRGWQVVGSFFVTGEEATYGTVTPKNQLDPARGTFGALEIVARYGEARMDQAAFDHQFADPAKSAKAAREWGVGLNWHLARNFKLMADYDRTNFEGGAKNGGDRPHEIVVLTRFQAAH
jgi:phosphate-selective porin OprO/OprP